MTNFIITLLVAVTCLFGYTTTRLINLHEEVDKHTLLCLAQQDMLSGYVDHHKPEADVYYKIEGYPGSMAGKPSLSDIYVFVSKVKLDTKTGSLVPNTYSYLREIRTPKNVILNPGSREHDPDTDGYLPTYFTVTMVNGALTAVLFDTPSQMSTFETSKK